MAFLARPRAMILSVLLGELQFSDYLLSVISLFQILQVIAHDAEEITTGGPVAHWLIDQAVDTHFL